MIIIYLILGYWAAGRTIYANKILIGSESKIMAERFAMGAVLGWILIPIAIIKMFL